MPSIFIFLSIIIWLRFNEAAEPVFHSPFTTRPLKIRLVNYERQYLPPRHVATPAEEMAERLVAPYAHNMPHYLQQNDEPIQSYSHGTFSGRGSYLQEVRRRMRVGGGKIHTSATAIVIPDDTETNNSKNTSLINDAKRLFENDEVVENRTRVTSVRRFTQKPQTTTSQPITTASTERSTTPVKVRPVLPRDDIIPLGSDLDHPKNVSLEPLSELEIKSDFALQKSLQRTTMRIETYTERPTTLSGKQRSQLPFSITTTSSPPVVFTLPTLFPTIPEQNIGQLPLQPVSALINASLGTGFSPAFSLQQRPQQTHIDRQIPASSVRTSTDTVNPSPEQLGCGFDLLTQSCKDVFGLGWCSQCQDFGNVFLHDCKCAVPTQIGRTANAILIATTPLPNGQPWTQTRN